MTDSKFYVTAYDALHEECQKLCDFTDTLNKNPEEKAKKIGEYKCAKYRYASLSLIQATLRNNNRFRKMCDLKENRYLLPFFHDIMKKYPDCISMYEDSPDEERPDCSLYCALIVFADERIQEMSSNLPYAYDWEKIELEERINGLMTAKQCLDKAWGSRKDLPQ